MTDITIVDHPALTIGDLRGSRKRLARERRVKLFLMGAAMTSVLISVLIVVSLVTEAGRFLSSADLGSLWTSGWFPREGFFDIKTLVVATLMVTGIAIVVAFPIGFASAVYLAEYASARSRRIIKPVLETLAGIPSVVLGFFALTWISPNVVQRLNPDAPLSNLFAAGLGVAILTIPLVASVSEDAMSSVPNALREASAGLGARRMTTSLRIVVPAAVSGLVAAAILAISRAIGETMVVLIAGGADQAQFTASPFQPSLTMTAAMASLAGGSDAVVGQGNAYQSLFFVGFLLFLITLGLNVAATRIVRRVRQKY
ncbi:MAG: phosphate ABC transporter permease subunit PstC [Acidimicrobiales bacterium]|nr:phosphate ABC transporter permease subunit PstC [Acidimicrobiales bacterium]